MYKLNCPSCGKPFYSETSLPDPWGPSALTVRCPENTGHKNPYVVWVCSECEEAPNMDAVIADTCTPIKNELCVDDRIGCAGLFNKGFVCDACKEYERNWKGIGVNSDFEPIETPPVEKLN